MPLPSSNNLEYARAYNEFTSESAIPTDQWGESIGESINYEPTYEDAHTATVRQAAAEASALADARIEARTVSLAVEHETIAEREQVVAYAHDIGEHIQWMRDLSKADFDLAA